MNTINIADIVRSYDFPGNRDHYAEGKVEAIVKQGTRHMNYVATECDRYAIKVSRMVRGDSVEEFGSGHSVYVYPPVNGTKTAMGNTTNGVEQLDVVRMARDELKVALTGLTPLEADVDAKRLVAEKADKELRAAKEAYAKVDKEHTVAHKALNEANSAASALRRRAFKSLLTVGKAELVKQFVGVKVEEFWNDDAKWVITNLRACVVLERGGELKFESSEYGEPTGKVIGYAVESFEIAKVTKKGASKVTYHAGVDRHRWGGTKGQVYKVAWDGAGNNGRSWRFTVNDVANSAEQRGPVLPDYWTLAGVPTNIKTKKEKE